jgi:hypothetical protein
MQTFSHVHQSGVHFVAWLVSFHPIQNASNNAKIRVDEIGVVATGDA